MAGGGGGGGEKAYRCAGKRELAMFSRPWGSGDQEEKGVPARGKKGREEQWHWTGRREVRPLRRGKKMSPSPGKEELRKKRTGPSIKTADEEKLLPGESVHSESGKATR